MRRTIVVSAVLFVWFGSGVIDPASGQIERPGAPFTPSYWDPSDLVADRLLRLEISNARNKRLNQGLYSRPRNVTVDRFHPLGSQQILAKTPATESAWVVRPTDAMRADSASAAKPCPDRDVRSSSTENTSYFSKSGEGYSPGPKHERLIPPLPPNRAIEIKTPLTTSIDSWLSLLLQDRSKSEPSEYSITSKSLLPEIARANQKRFELPRGTGIFDYEGGYINPYYPYPMDTPRIRIGANDYHEGWVSKYLYTKSTVSPYLNLLRHDVIRLYGSTRYHTFVRPLLDERAEQISSSTLNRPIQIHFDTRTMQGTVRRISPDSRTTGHPTHFMGHFATTWR